MVVDGSAEVLAMFPLTVYVEQCPVGSIEDTLLSVVGTGPSSIDWDWFRWPLIPELGLDARAKDAALQIAINCRDVNRDVPSADHTVFLHIREGDTARAEWLAAQVGLQIIGPAQLGW